MSHEKTMELAIASQRSGTSQVGIVNIESATITKIVHYLDHLRNKHKSTFVAPPPVADKMKIIELVIDG
jgi:hypothetical protein